MLLVQYNHTHIMLFEIDNRWPGKQVGPRVHSRFGSCVWKWWEMGPIFHRMGLTELFFGSLTRTGGSPQWLRFLTGEHGGRVDGGTVSGDRGPSRLFICIYVLFLHLYLDTSAQVILN